MSMFKFTSDEILIIFVENTGFNLSMKECANIFHAVINENDGKCSYKIRKMLF